MKICSCAIALLLTLAVPFAVRAQQAEEESVTAVVRELLKAIELGDSSRVRKVFTPDATLVTLFRNKDDQPVLRRETLRTIVDAVGTPHQEVWYEEIWNVRVSVDGDLASVWCDYAFFVDKNFSHCGADAFHLRNGAGGWKIFHLADTRRRQGCDVPEEVRKRRQ